MPGELRARADAATGGTCREKRLCRSYGGRHNVSAIQKIKVRRRWGSRLMCERKVGLIEGDMARDDDLIGSKVKTPIAFVVSRVTQEDAHDRTGSEFVCRGSIEVRVALATKDTKMIICHGRAEQGCVWRRHIECLGGEDVQKLGRRMKCLDPEGGRDRGLK